MNSSFLVVLAARVRGRFEDIWSAVPCVWPGQYNNEVSSMSIWLFRVIECVVELQVNAGQNTIRYSNCHIKVISFSIK